MPLEDIRVEFSPITAANGGNKIRLVRSAAISRELLDLFPVIIIGPTSASTT